MKPIECVSAEGREAGRPTLRNATYPSQAAAAPAEAAGLCDRPRTPRRSPRATVAAIVSKTLYLRQTYHFGAGRIADYLKRFHDVAIARSSVHRLLGKHGMGRLPANQKHRPHGQRWQRYEEAAARAPAASGCEA